MLVVTDVRIDLETDGVPHYAWLRIPDGYSPDVPVPLMMGLHNWGGHASSVLEAFYADDVAERGWLLLAPDRGERFVAMLDLQHQFKHMVDYVCDNYAVDPNRIYVMGVSGGGYRSIIMAEKYPDVFAAAVDIKGPMDLNRWYYEDYSEKHTHQIQMSQDIGNPSGSTGGPLYERYSCLFGEDHTNGLVRNLKHVPVAILQNTGHDYEEPLGTFHYVVAPHHAYDLEGALVDWGSDEVAWTHYYPGNHSKSPSDEKVVELLDWLETKSLQVDHFHLAIKTDESKTYYWLDVQQQARPDPARDDPWTAVEASYNGATGAITATVTDTLSSDLRFNLQQMGLDPTARYVVENRDLSTNAFILSYSEPSDGWLMVSTGSGGEHELIMYPETEYRRIKIVQDPDAIHDTYLLGWERDKRDQYDDPELRLRKDDVYSPLIKFVDFADIPPGAHILSAAIRLFVAAVRDNPPADLRVDAYKVNKHWENGEASYNEARDGENWAQSGCNGLGEDRDAEPCSSDKVRGVGTWCSFDVTEAAQEWLDDAASNQGVIVKCDRYHVGGYYVFASSEHETADWRPQLVVAYEYVPPTPTPTDTRSPTPTGTPTATPTGTCTPSATLTTIYTLTSTPSATPSSTWTPTSNPSATATEMCTPTNTSSATPSSTHTGTETPSATPSSTWTPTSTPSATPSYRVYLSVVQRPGR